MGFGDRLAASWQLVKQCWHVLMQDKELLLFPIISGVAAIALVVPLVVLPMIGGASLPLPIFILWYFTASFLTIFNNAALVACVKKRLKGGNPTIGYGYGEAFKRIGAIFLWSLIATSVGLLLRALEERAGENILARIVIGLLGMAWTLVTFFVIPVIVIEGTGTFASIKRSTSLLRKTWGEQIIVGVGLGTAFGLFYILVIVVGFVTVLLSAVALVPIIFALLLLVILVAAIVHITMEGVFTGVLYSYAVGDNVPLAFKSAANTAFQKKQK